MPQIDEILANPATWGQYGPDVQAALANLSGNATQFPSRLSSSFQDPPGLSQSTIRGNGDTAVAIDPQNRLSVLMDRQRAPAAPPLPDNYIRNNSTGRVIDAGPSYNEAPAPSRQPTANDIIRFAQINNVPQEQVMPMIQYQAANAGRGPSAIDLYTQSFRSGIPFEQLMAAQSAEIGGQRGREKEDLLRRKQESEITGQDLENIAKRRSLNSTGIGQDVLTNRYGKAPDGSRWTPDGRLERITGGPQDVAAQELAQTVTKNIDELIGQRDSEGKLIGDSKPHEGFYDAVGATWKPGAQYVPGTDASDFKARLEQLLGGAFLEAYKTLKGGGQITEVEGKKATAAITRMNLSQSEKEFVAAAQEFKSAVESGMRKLGGDMGSGEQRGATKAEIQPPDGAIRMLMAHPNTAALFDAKYGTGSSAKILGQ